VVRVLPNTGTGSVELDEAMDSDALGLILAGALALAGVVAIGRRRLA
jgi:hypothetical protein